MLQARTLRLLAQQCPQPVSAQLLQAPPCPVPPPLLLQPPQEDLLHDLYDIPARSCDRRVNEFVKRVR